MINYTGMITDISVITEFIQMVVYYVFATILIATSQDIFLKVSFLQLRNDHR